MHHIYHTEGIILNSKNFGEAGKYYFIFTRDFGMVMASAQGVRKISSKLRFVLQDFAYLKIDLVKGKDLWRITNASKTNLLEDITKNKMNFSVFANLSRLLRRLLQGEDRNESLFTDFLNGLFILEKCKTKEDLHNTEVVMVLRILSNLGYIGESMMFKTFVKSPLEEELVYEVAKNRRKILEEINKILRETQL
ncbi:DNA repair protein RecO [Candidatus Nomurabacteria bacterium]|nr:DNA repair protein RecO [Candidatus Nomurabacteria bacterium]